MVILHNDAPELRNFDRFMVALWKRLEDLLDDRKARDHIKTISKGQRGVAEYTQQFHHLACRPTVGHPDWVFLGWAE